MLSALGRYVREVVNVSSSVFEGLVVTMANFLRRPITIQYPDRTERPVVETLPGRYRGFVEVDVRLCTACGLCEAACPVQCISIGIESGGQRLITSFDVDIGKCLYCGLCVEPCPTGAIRMTPEFEGATDDLCSLVLHYVPEGQTVMPVKAKQALETETPPRGQLAREAIARTKRQRFVS